VAQVIKTKTNSIRIVIVSAGLENPWGLAFLPDKRMLVTERPGRLRVIGADGKLDPQPVGGLPPIAVTGQGGLLDVALHPKYAENGWIYLSYAAPGDGGYGTEVLRGRLQGNTLVDVQIIFRMQPKKHHRTPLRLTPGLRPPRLPVHHARRSRRTGARPRLDDHAGSVIRLHDDGRVPADQPVRRPARRPAGEVHARQPQHAGVRRCTRRPANYGRTSTARRAATRSTSSVPASITAGRSSLTAAIT